jgi:hypothetical protein
MLVFPTADLKAYRINIRLILAQNLIGDSGQTLLGSKGRQTNHFESKTYLTLE